MSKGDAAHAAQVKHGIQPPAVAGTVDKTVYERLAALEARVTALEALEVPVEIPEEPETLASA